MSTTAGATSGATTASRAALARPSDRADLYPLDSMSTFAASRAPRSARRAPSRFASRLAAIACVACAAPFASAAGAPAGSTPDSPVGDALRLWIDANEQVELEGVYFGESDTPRARRDVGVFAAVGGLDEGEAYVSVPWDLVLGPHSIEAHRPELHRVLTQLRAEYGADDKSALVLALVHERFASPEDSPWRRYLDALPDPDADGSGFDTPLYWDPHLLRELMGSEVLDDAIAEQARIRAVHKGFTRRVFDASPPEMWPGRARSFEATRWAWSIAHSRASAVPGKGLALVPLADMINDRGRNPAAADSNPVAGADFVVHDPHYDRAAVYAKRSYAPGEEVTEYYGGWNMADTLLSAGYLPAPAAAGEDPAVSDCALLNLSPPDETKASALRDAGFETPWRVCLSARRGSREARRVAAWAVIVAGDAADRSDDEDAAGSSSPGWRAGAVVAKTLEARLAEYPTAAEEDEDALRAYREELAAMAKATGEAGGQEAEAEAERARRLTRVALATELRAREKRIMSRILSDLRDAGGDAFAWADPDYAATEQARMEREERGVEEEDEEDEAESAWAKENVTSSAKAREEL